MWMMRRLASCAQWRAVASGRSRCRRGERTWTTSNTSWTTRPASRSLEHGRYFDHRDVQSRFPEDEFLVQMGFRKLPRGGPRRLLGLQLRLGVMGFCHEPGTAGGSQDCRVDARACSRRGCRGDGAAALGTDASGQRSQESSHPERHSRRHVRARPRRQSARLLPVGRERVWTRPLNKSSGGTSATPCCWTPRKASRGPWRRPRRPPGLLRSRFRFRPRRAPVWTICWWCRSTPTRS